MGYRMYIECRGYTEFEFPKFYGYVKLDGLKSIKYLLDKKLIKDPEEFNTLNFGPSFAVTAEEFREFMDLYQEDIQNYDFSSYCISYDKPFLLSDYWKYFKVVYDNDYPKHIEWL